MIPSRFFPLVLLLVASSLFFLRLDCALLEPEEARYAEIPREMLAAHEWIVPQYHGQVYYDKPPLLYWTVMLSYCVFGVNDWAARLVPGVCGVLCVMMTFFWGLRILGAHPAFFGALVLALSCRFVYLGRLVATDAPLSGHECQRLAARAVYGLGRTGSSYSNGSGDFAIAFTTAPGSRVKFGATQAQAIETLPAEGMSPLFEAALEATEEAVYNSLLKATTVRGNGRTVEAIPVERLRALLAARGVH